VSVVLRGEVLAIEFPNERPAMQVKVSPGQVDRDEPGDHTHRTMNIGGVPYEEVTVFFLAHHDDVPQPEASS
jgi:hypothetical protein